MRYKTKYTQDYQDLKISYVPHNNKHLNQPWSSLPVYYKNINNNDRYIISNTQVSEMLNKFNESRILPKLGEYELNSLRQDNYLTENVIEEITKDDSKLWINWLSLKGIVVKNNLIRIANNDFSGKFNNDTLKVLGRIKLLKSTSYGNKTEEDINKYLDNEDRLELSDQSWEVKTFIRLLKENNLFVVDKKVSFITEDLNFKGEIDYLVYNPKINKYMVLDLKTSSSTINNIDYWRQTLNYVEALKTMFDKELLNEETSIIYINKLKNNEIIRFLDNDLKPHTVKILKRIVSNTFKVKSIYEDILTEYKK